MRRNKAERIRRGKGITWYCISNMALVVKNGRFGVWPLGFASRRC